MKYTKSRLAVLTEDTIGLSHTNEDMNNFDPEDTIYDLRTKNIKVGTVVVIVEVCEDTSTSMILLDDDTYWVCSKSLDVRT